MEDIVSKFLRYVSFETTSDPESKTAPSSPLELVLANQLLQELDKLGINCSLAKGGIVYGHIPSNCKDIKQKVGFIAHMDTSPDASGKDVKARIVKDYDGEDILLNKKENIVMRVADFPALKDKKGESLIVTDGTTLLGADDKAGIAVIMAVAEYLVEHPEFKHGDIMIAFTPDEEIGRGAENFDVPFFNCDFAYTIDGAAVNCIEYENFNAASAEVIVKGINIHPGSAKNKMVNSMILAQEFNSLIPESQTPERTEGYEGFYHLTQIEGTVEKTTLSYIIRHHDAKAFKEQKEYLKKLENFINEKHHGNFVEVKIKDSYRNMKELFKDKMFIIELATKAMVNVGLDPISLPIRGGTDGANLTYMGLPCPNLGAGGYNFHGRFEYLSIDEMKKSKDLVLEIIKNVK